MLLNNLLFRKSYKRRPGGRDWTKNTLLTQIFDAIGSSVISTNGNPNSWSINKDAALSMEFGSSNYADANKIEIICSLAFKLSDGPFTWETLFNICKQVYGEKYRCLTIYKDEDFEGSNIERECQEVFAPLISLLQDNKSLSMMIKGEPITLNGEMVTLRKIDNFVPLPVKSER